MRAFFTTICLLAIAITPLKAQYSGIGVRQGVGLWLMKDGIGTGTIKYAQGDHFSWNKELFFREKLKNKWAYETSLTTYTMENISALYRSYETERTRSKATYVESSISLQYDMTYPLAGYIFPRLVNMKSYVGFAFIPRLAFENINKTVTNNQDFVETNTQHKATTLSFFVGFNYTHIVPITKRLALTSVFSFKMKPFDGHFNTKGAVNEPNQQVSISTGLCYTL